MLFEKVNKEHIIQAIKDFEEKGIPNGFGPSSTYDVIYKGKRYPPPSIMAYAYLNAEGKEVESNFKVGKNSECFNAFERNGFKIEKKMKNEKLYKLKKDFLDYWSLEKLEKMTLEEYTDTKRENSFCYWLEHITRDLGSIVGGSSYKFGIYKMGATSKTESATNRTNDGVYAWHIKYGATRDDAFSSIKTILLNIAKHVQQDNLKLIDDIDLGNAYKWKIAFLYGDYNCVNMFKLDTLRVIASNLEINYNNKTPISFFHKAILNLKPQEEEYFTYCHALWKEYQERQVDVKKDFAKWLNKNTFDSYRAYLGFTNKSIEEKLDEINNFFDDIDFFLVDPKNVNGLVSTILFMMSKKERIKNHDFIEYDTKNSNGIPKAVLGKNNYIKFLTEKFNYIAPNYWIFQGNPSVYNIAAALKAGHLKSWKVAAHKDKIKIGDQIIIWQTGGEAGCFALAEVTSDVRFFEEEQFEQQYYTETVYSQATDRVKIKILKNLVEDPILWKELKKDPVFSNFKAGNQGTNFSASQVEFNALLNWNNKKDIKYWLYSPGGSADHWDEFYNANIMAIGWDRLGNLQQYKSKEEIREALDEINGNNNPKPNKVVANYEFVNTMQIGDVVIAKKGRGKLIGYGIITSDYFFDVNRKTYKSCRKVDWKLKGEWHSDHKLVLKTLTDITVYDSEYEEYDKYSDYLMGLMSIDLKETIVLKKLPTMIPNNQILYGPPGTGKTFYLKEQLFDKYTSKETSISQEQNFENVVSSCSWWQVIAIALLDLKKAKVSAIFKHKWVQKKASLSNSKTVRPTLWGQLQSHTIESCEFVNVANRQQPLIFNKTDNSYWEILEDEVKDLVPELYNLKESVDVFEPDPDKIIKHFEFVTFHQSFAYEDFIEGIKPVFPESEEETKDLGYQIEDGVFKKLCLRAKNDPENKYAIFIDEINRGNVSAIFGELITLIETDKRTGAKNELSIKLPYSKNEFSVPSNLDIYGTMNTADRSVEALDTALRRRFEFKEMMPDYNVIANEVVNEIQLSKVLENINDRIELLIDRDHTIGHSYFVGVDTLEKLANAFNNKIVPLLQEYFYGDYGKIGLVLGKGFVEKQNNNTITFADFSYDNANDFITSSYALKKVEKDTIIEAVQMLLGKTETE